ncbi:hypothetical protein J2X69_002196 [Algoriphagus sp. 4150]|nr:hypothetical protein [Algoriphagus sp. 4150]
MDRRYWRQIRIEFQFLSVENLINTGLTYLTRYSQTTFVPKEDILQNTTMLLE